MNGVLGTLLPLAIAVTISPIPIIAEILLLFTGKPKATAGAYLLGFVVGVAAVLVLLVVVANAANLSKTGSRDGATTLQLVAGIVLLVAAVRRFRAGRSTVKWRPRPSGWQTSPDSAPPSPWAPVLSSGR